MNRSLVGGLGAACLWSLVMTVPAVAAPPYSDRSEIDAKYKWTLEDIYADNAAWEADFKKLEATIPGLAGFQGHLGDGAAGLLAALEARDGAHQAVTVRCVAVRPIDDRADRRVGERGNPRCAARE